MAEAEHVSHQLLPWTLTRERMTEAAVVLPRALGALHTVMSEVNARGLRASGLVHWVVGRKCCRSCVANQCGADSHPISFRTHMYLPTCGGCRPSGGGQRALAAQDSSGACGDGDAA